MATIVTACLPASIARRGAVGVGGPGNAGRELARHAATTAARALGDGGSVVFALETDGSDDDVTSSVEGLSAADARVEAYGGGWVAEAAYTPRPESALPPASILLKARGDSPNADPAEALRRAENQAYASLVRRSLSERNLTQPGRYTGRLLLTGRTIEAGPHGVTLTLDARSILDAPQPLPDESRCRIPLLAAMRLWTTRDAALDRLRRAANTCPAHVGALADQARATLERGESEDAKKLTRKAIETPLKPPVAAKQADAAASTTAPTSTTVTVSAPASTANGTTTVEVKITTTASTPATAPVPPKPRCREGTVLLAGGTTPYPLPDGRTANVTVKPFCLDRTEATEGYGTGRKTRRVASSVTWTEANKACAKAGGRLPTEAEWVFAAQGAEGRPYPWGSEAPSCVRANTSECGGVAQEAGALAAGATPEGVLDLGGNLREWVTDLWTPVPFDAADDGEAVPGARVLRGAGWSTPAAQATATLRAGEGLSEHFREASIGYRCAYEAGPAAP